ncbi:MAG: hypothetical protein LBT79_04390 [Elusimicrobiota bacterium]|nr:hypothetical protein [Elusimicrobiota bacterium]
MQSIYRNLAKTGIMTAIDVIAEYKSCFKEKSELPTLENKVSSKGALLYERS